MGWMHDTLEYFSKEPIHRSHHQNAITFSIMYAFTENFMLPLSHDEVVHGKGSLIRRMPGDEWQRFANGRLLYASMYTHPGSKLNFMGNEIGQTQEWKHDQSLDWHLLEWSPHQGMKRFIQDLNKLYVNEKPLHELSYSEQGFEWIEWNDHVNSAISFLRKDKKGNSLVVVANFTPTLHKQYRIGVPFGKSCKEIFNSDAGIYGGSDALNNKIEVEDHGAHGRANSISITLPPLGVAVFKGE